MSKKILCMFLLLSMVWTNCGAITRGSLVKQKISSIDSQGRVLADVKVIVNGTHLATTDSSGRAQFSIAAPDRHSQYTVPFEKDGFISREYTVNPKIYGGYVVGDIFLVLLGIITLAVSFGVDGGTDAWYIYPPLNVDLVPIRSS